AARSAAPANDRAENIVLVLDRKGGEKSPPHAARAVAAIIENHRLSGGGGADARRARSKFPGARPEETRGLRRSRKFLRPGRSSAAEPDPSRGSAPRPRRPRAAPTARGIFSRSRRSC